MFRVSREFLKVRSHKVELQVRIASPAADVGNQLHARTDIRKLRQNFPRLLHHLKLRPAPRAAGDFVPPPAQLGQPAVNRRNGHHPLAFAEPAAGIANGDERIHDRDLLADAQRAQALLDLVANLGGALQVRTFGRLQ